MTSRPVMMLFYTRVDALSLSKIPELLYKVLKEEAWREFETQLGKHVTYDRFEDFVTTSPLAGLGTDIDLIRRIVKDDPITLNELDRTLQRPEGKPKQTVYIIHNIERPSGTSETRALRMLRDHRPDLHSRVLTGELSSHAAMLEAKFRRPTMTVILDNPKSAASLITRASPEFLQELKRLLS